MFSNTVPPPPPPWAQPETPRGHMGEPDEFLLEAMREVDALTPACPPIAPQPSPTYRREEWLASLRVPDAPAAGVYPARRP